jgi:predicted nucleic acid-binding protein
LKISLDSNVFRDQLFIEWLETISDEISIEISVVVALETYYWYILRKLTKIDFQQDIMELHAKIQPFLDKDIYHVAENANKSSLRIKHHARDFIIGTQADIAKSLLITLNKKHFEWLPKEKVLTPDEFAILFAENQ